ncbi:LINE-1 retrotransposable element ORF2 protein [Nymphaea thermarum]|nr:LINE-1 retrotransposable element ORF2 protein [Nymphaea thermarum]
MEAQKVLRDIMVQAKPEIGFVSDFMVDSQKLHAIMKSFTDYDFLSNANVLNGRGRIMFFWRKNVVQVLSYIVDTYWVGMCLKDLRDGRETVIFGIYLPTRLVDRLESLIRLEAVVSRINGPCMVIGDFNAMMGSWNKTGAPLVARSSLAFNRFITSCLLTEVEDPYKKFTWSNHRRGPHAVLCKLDWCFVNGKWVSEFGGRGTLKVTTSSTSDHNLLVYQTSTNAFLNKGRRPFRLFKPWIMDSDGLDTVKKEWGSNVTGCPMIRLLKKLGLVKAALPRWNAEKFGRLESRIVNLRLHLDQSRLLVERIEDGDMVTDEENQWMLRPIMREEIVMAVKSLDKDSAAGPDGFPNYFYKDCWSIIGDDVVVAVQDFFIKAKLVGSVNHTMICLIAKKQNAIRVEEYRPISLCNTIYKIIAKIIVIRMRGVIMRLNSMHVMGFHPRWIELVMKCVTSVSYEMVINGRLGDRFTASKGLRQGDPMSPYLFILVMEIFNRRIQVQVRNKTIHIPKIRNVSHETEAVMYADDVLMVSKASISSFCAIKDMLEQFEKFAGMKVNKDKSVIFLGKIIDCTVEELRNILHWSIGSLPADYLGVPFFCGRLTEDMCCPLISKMEIAGKLRVAGNSYYSDGVNGMAILLSPRGRVLVGELEVMEKLFRYQKEYGGRVSICTRIEPLIRRIRQHYDGNRIWSEFHMLVKDFHYNVKIERDHPTANFGSFITSHVKEWRDVFLCAG